MNIRQLFLTSLFLLIVLDISAQCGGSSNLIPNPSFEINTCCPTKFGSPTCITNWVISQVSPDYYSDCGTGSGPATGCCGLPPYPYPDGSMVVGFTRISPVAGTEVRERMGVCLTSTLISGNSYTFTYKAASTGTTIMNLGVFGTNNCSNLTPAISSTATLPATFTQMAQSVLATSNTGWVTGSVTFIAPFNVTGIVIGGDNSPAGPPYTSSSFPNYFFIDSLSLVETSVCPSGGSGSTWTWTGCLSTDWFNACNWDRLSVPTVSSNVIIPNTVNKPLISGGTANCFDITIQSSLGARLDINSSGGGVLNVTKP